MLDDFASFNGEPRRIDASAGLYPATTVRRLIQSADTSKVCIVSCLRTRRTIHLVVPSYIFSGQWLERRGWDCVDKRKANSAST